MAKSPPDCSCNQIEPLILHTRTGILVIISGILGYWLSETGILGYLWGIWDIGHEDFRMNRMWGNDFLMVNIPISQIPHGYPNIPVSERQYPNIPVSERQYPNIPEKITNIPDWSNTPKLWRQVYYPTGPNLLKRRVYLTKLRLSNHILNIEMGRRNNYDRVNRLCHFCTEGAVEDEMHFLFSCSPYNFGYTNYHKGAKYHKEPQRTDRLIFFTLMGLGCRRLC